MSTSRALWTEEEDRTLRLALTRRRRRVTKVNWTAVLKMLPGRTKHGALKRAEMLGIDRGRTHWTPEEDRVIRAEWGELGRRGFECKLPRRTWHAILCRAVALGYSSIPQGWERVSTAARALGFERTALLRIVAWFNAMIDAGLHDGERVLIRLHTTTHGSSHERDRYGTRRHRLVQRDEAERAVTLWMRAETAVGAGERLGVAGCTLAGWCRDLGFVMPAVPSGDHTRLLPEHFDRAAAANGYAAGGQPVATHARRLGMDPSTLLRRLARAGLHEVKGVAGRGKARWYTVAQVDAALAGMTQRAA